MAAPKCGTFTLNGSLGNQSITGLGFQPSGLIILLTGDTADFSGGGDAILGIGFTDGTNQCCVSARVEDGNSTTDTRRIFVSDDLANIPGGASDTEFPVFDIVSLNSDGFTIDNLTTSTYQIHYIAFDSTEHDCKVGTFDVNTSTGNQQVSSLGMTPDLVGFIGSINDATEGVINQFGIQLGFMNADGDQQSTSVMDQDGLGATTSKVKCVSRNDAAFIQTESTGSYLDVVKLAFVNMSSDQFTFNVQTAPASATRVGYICISDIDSAFEEIVIANSTSAQAFTGFGLAPELVFFHGERISDPPDGTLFSSSRWMFGCFDGTNHFHIGTASDDNQPSSSTARTNRSDRSIHDMAASGGTASTGSFSSLDADGTTLQLTTATAERRRFLIALSRANISPSDTGELFARGYPNHSSRGYPAISSRGYPRS